MEFEPIRIGSLALVPNPTYEGLFTWATEGAWGFGLLITWDLSFVDRSLRVGFLKTKSKFSGSSMVILSFFPCFAPAAADYDNFLAGFFNGAKYYLLAPTELFLFVFWAILPSFLLPLFSLNCVNVYSSKPRFLSISFYMSSLTLVLYNLSILLPVS